MIRANYLGEPLLLFNKGGTTKTPCQGLLKYGPRKFPESKKEFHRIRLGIIGTSREISLFENLLEEMLYHIIPQQIRSWRLPFPGLSEHSPLKFSISTDRTWIQEILFKELRDFHDIEKMNDKIEYILELLEKKIRIISSKETPPDVIVICIPREVEEKCCKIGMKKPLIKLDSHDDFHNRIKVYGMKYHMPTQLIRSDTLLQKGTQDKSTIAWNLAIGLLYKAQRGHPWKLARLEENSCFVGISFYKEVDEEKDYLRTSLAQVFIDTGESFVLRGDKFEWTDRRHSRSPHLPEEDAAKLIEKVIHQYYEIKSQEPSRIVIHKTSNYWDEEFSGFISGSEAISKKDFLTIQGTKFRFFRPDKFPIMRGTLISIDNSHDFYLYTTGFVPSLKTFPGISIPTPLLVRSKVLDSKIEDICKEILSLTKLDWNNTFVYNKRPITMAVSERVGHILAESEAKNIEIDPHYYYYM